MIGYNPTYATSSDEMRKEIKVLHKGDPYYFHNEVYPAIAKYYGYNVTYEGKSDIDPNYNLYKYEKYISPEHRPTYTKDQDFVNIKPKDGYKPKSYYSKSGDISNGMEFARDVYKTEQSGYVRTATTEKKLKDHKEKMPPKLTVYTKRNEEEEGFFDNIDWSKILIIGGIGAGVILLFNILSDDEPKRIQGSHDYYY